MSETFYALIKRRVASSVLAFHAQDRERRTDLWDRCVCYTANRGQGHGGGVRMDDPGQVINSKQGYTLTHTHAFTNSPGSKWILDWCNKLGHLQEKLVNRTNGTAEVKPAV